MKLYKFYNIGVKIYQMYTEELYRFGFPENDRPYKFAFNWLPRQMDKYEIWRENNGTGKTIWGDMGMALAGAALIVFMVFFSLATTLMILIGMAFASLGDSSSARMAAQAAEDAGDYSSASHHWGEYHARRDYEEQDNPMRDRIVSSFLVPIVALYHTVKRILKKLFRKD